MEIFIDKYKVETKNILRIVDIEHDKKMFLNREAGFIIQFTTTEPDLVFGEKIPYDSTLNEICDIKERWIKRKNDIINEWQKDKIEHKVF